MNKFFGVILISILFNLITLIACNQYSNKIMKIDSHNSFDELNNEQDDITKIIELIEKFRTPNFNQINSYKKEIVEIASKKPYIRQETIIKLLKNVDTYKTNLNTPENYGYWSGSVLTLGDLKSLESIELLGDLIDLNNGLFSYHLESFPCAFALMRIGNPAIEKLINIIKLKPQSGRINRLLAVMVISQIGGKENKIKLIDLLKIEKDLKVVNAMKISIKRM